MIERKLTNIKAFMHAFLMTDTWDDWQLTGAELSLAVSWSIDGAVNRSFFAEEEDSDNSPDTAYMPWGQLRPAVLSLIRGNHTPSSFRFMLLPPAALSDDKDPSGSAIERVCRIRFAEGCLYAASAVTMKEFSLDKEPERLWDAALSRFLDEKGIDYEIL